MLAGLHTTQLVLVFIGGIVLDWLFGEVRRWHPLVGFGQWAGMLERRLNRVASGKPGYLLGVLAWMTAVLPWVGLAWWAIASVAAQHMLLALALHSVLLYFSLGLRSLHEHTAPIERALMHNDLPAARQLTSRIVSRDTEQANAQQLANAAVESLLENGNDAVFGTLFWFVIAGGPGALLFRLANTLDAMWGYRTPRYLAFGWCAARIDDVANWVPARLTASSYTVLGNSRQAWRCWRTQAPAWSSPNAGPVMAAGAGALEVALGGAAQYHGVIEHRPPLGSGRAAQAADIGRAWRLVVKTTVLWIIVLALAGAMVERMQHA